MEEQPKLKEVGEIYRVSKPSEYAGIPVFNRENVAITYYNLQDHENELYVKPYKVVIHSYEKRLENKFHEEAPFGLDTPEGFKPIGAIIAGESNNLFLGFFLTERDIEIHKKQRGNNINTYIIPVLDLENIKN